MQLTLLRGTTSRPIGSWNRLRTPNAISAWTSQTLTEFFSVVTNSRRVKSPLSPNEAVEVIERLLALPGITSLAITPEVTQRWLELVRQTPVRGAGNFDLQLAATALVHGVTRICTFNVGDFEAIAGLEIIRP